MDINIVYMIDHDERKKKSVEERKWRKMTFAEALNITKGSMQRAILSNRRGPCEMGRVKVTSIHTWKTRPNDLEIHTSYGLYDHAKFFIINGEWKDGYALYVEVTDAG